MQQHAGNLEMTEQAARRRRRPAVGWSVVRSWRGAQTKCAAFLTNGLLPGGLFTFAMDLDVTEDLDGMATVTAEFAVEDGTGSGSGSPLTPSDPVSRVWELEGNDIEISPFALPQVQTTLAKLGITQRAILVSDILHLVQGTPTVVGQEVATDDEPAVLATAENILAALRNAPGITDADVAVVRNLMEAMASGIDSFPHSQYVLRKTETVVVSLTKAKASHEHKGKMLTWSTLNQLEPTLLNDPVTLLIDAANLNDDANPTYWLKRTPRTPPATRGQWQIIQEYWAFQDFNKFVYGAKV